MPEKNWKKLTFLDFSFTSVDLGNSLMVINLVNSVENVGSHGKKEKEAAFPKRGKTRRRLSDGFAQLSYWKMHFIL